MLKSTSIIAFVYLFGAGLSYGSFELVNVGARAQALGGYTAVSNDIYSQFYNPGGLGLLKYPEIAAEYGRLWYGLGDSSNLSEGMLGYARPLSGGSSAIAVSWHNFSLLEYYSESSIIISYGKKILEDVSFGLNLKSLYQSYVMDEYTRADNVFDNGNRTNKLVYSIDQGIIWNFSYPDYFVGISLFDVNQPDIGLYGSENLPMKINLGFAYKYNAETDNPLTTGVDITYGNAKFLIGAGIERIINDDKTALRLGFKFGSDNYYSVSAGIGFKIGGTRLDYCLNMPAGGIENTGGNNRISIDHKSMPTGEALAATAESYQREKKDLEEKIQDLESQLKKIPSVENQATEIESLKAQIRQLQGELNDKDSRIRVLQQPRQEKQQAVAREKEETGPRKHIVLKGETLPSIAVKYYGNSARWKDIYNVNKDKIERGQIKEGQVLIIP